MRYGVREICDVVLRAKAKQVVGNKTFFKHEPVLYFDSLKTSSLEGASTTVYATGGRGNSRLVAWDGERTITFVMEDALISPESFMILSGAGLMEASSDNKLKIHATETIEVSDVVGIFEDGSLASSITSISMVLGEKPYQNAGEQLIYVMGLSNGSIVTEPFIAYVDSSMTGSDGKGIKVTTSDAHGYKGLDLDANLVKGEGANRTLAVDAFLVDYYVEKVSGARQIDIAPDKFGGNYYLEASTLFRSEDGVDYPAEFIIPNCKIQSNFTFSMASSGDPSSFTFTMDAFPDYTRFDHSKKVLAALQIVDPEGGAVDAVRTVTNAI